MDLGLIRNPAKTQYRWRGEDARGGVPPGTMDEP